MHTTAPSPSYKLALVWFLIVVFAASCLGAFIYDKALVASPMERAFFIWMALLPCIFASCAILPEVAGQRVSKLSWCMLIAATTYLSVAFFYQDRVPALKAPTTKLSVATPAPPVV